MKRAALALLCLILPACDDASARRMPPSIPPYIHHHTAMTKAEELDRLKRFIASMPEASYLRPWLTSVLPDVESDIRSDIIPWITPADSRNQARGILDGATSHAKRIRENAEEHCRSIIGHANKTAASITASAAAEASRIRDGLASDIHTLRHALNQVA